MCNLVSTNSCCHSWCYNDQTYCKISNYSQLVTVFWRSSFLCGDGYHLHKATQLIWCSKHEVELVIQFLNARNESAAEIHCQLVTVYANDTKVKRQIVTASTQHKTHVQDTIIETRRTAIRLERVTQNGCRDHSGLGNPQDVRVTGVVNTARRQRGI